MTSKVDIRVRELSISLRELAHEINELGLHLEFRPWVLLAEDGVSIVQIKETLTWRSLGAIKNKTKMSIVGAIRGVAKQIYGMYINKCIVLMGTIKDCNNMGVVC